jgi:hypothetical protein
MAPNLTFCIVFNCSGPETEVITNSEIRKHIEAAATEFAPLHENHGGFSFWNGPRYFVANEPVHNDDGLHFAWTTLFNLDMVNPYYHCLFNHQLEV